MKRYSPITILAITIAGCVYYNTFFLAKKNFSEAEDLRKDAGQEIAKGSALGKYDKVIEKASEVLEFHPDSKYVDDALYLIGRSFYHKGEFSKAETKFRELLVNHPESEYAEESSFYLGKSRFWNEDFVGAREVFERLDTTAHDKDIRSESQYMLAEILYTQEAYERCIPVYRSYLEEYGKDELAATTQFKIAESFFSLEEYDNARLAYIRVLEHDPDDSLRFQSMFKAGECYYQVEKYDSGLVIFEDLAEDEKNFSEMPDLYLMIGDGQRLSERYDEAMSVYRKLIEEYPRTEQSAIAFFHLGTIYQEHQMDLETAKAMYDSSIAVNRRAPVSSEAIARSADIGNLESYRTGKSAEAVDEAIESRYLLAELFLSQLDHPDSALIEFEALADSFPESKYAARALLAIGWIHDNVYNDSSAAEQYYERFLADYPSSDNVPDVLKRLGRLDELPNYDYPEKRYDLAEALLLDQHNYDSATVILQSIIDDFPESEYAAKADYALAWSLTRFQDIANPDSGDSGELIIDSTYILAFQNVMEDYDGTVYAEEARRFLGLGGSSGGGRSTNQEEHESDSLIQVAEFDSVAYIDSINRAIEDEIAELIPAPDVPTSTGDFEYPLAAYDTEFQGEVLIKIKINFTGEISDWEMLRGSGNEDIDFAVSETLKYTVFNPADIDPADYDKWFLYKFYVQLPEELRNTLRGE